MIRYCSTHTINRPPPVVFEALLDPARYGEWTEMQGTTWDGDGPVRVGTSGSFRMASGPFAGALRMEVVELAPDRRFVARVTHPKFDWLSTADLEPDGAGMRVTYAGEIRFRGVQRLLEPFIRGEVARGDKGGGAPQSSARGLVDDHRGSVDCGLTASESATLRSWIGDVRGATR